MMRIRSSQATEVPSRLAPPAVRTSPPSHRDDPAEHGDLELTGDLIGRVLYHVTSVFDFTLAKGVHAEGPGVGDPARTVKVLYNRCSS